MSSYWCILFPNGLRLQVSFPSNPYYIYNLGSRGKILALEGLISNGYSIVHSELATVSNEQNEQNRPDRPKDNVKKGAEYWGLPAVFTGANHRCSDFTVDEQYTIDHPEDKDYRERMAAGINRCYDCLWESDNKCVHAKCLARPSFFDGYDLCPECDADIGKQVRSKKWPNCPWCGTKLNHSDFYPLVKKDNTKDEQCEHKRLYMKFAWAQNLEAESEWHSIFGETSKTYHLRMTKGGEWQNHSWQQDSLHVRRVVCLDCNELLYDRGNDSWSIVPECVRQIIRDASKEFMRRSFRDMKENGFVVVYEDKKHITQWKDVLEPDRVK